jgi:hypothetical protein
VQDSGCHVARRYRSRPRMSARKTRFGASATPLSMHPGGGSCHGRREWETSTVNRQVRD